MTEENKIEIPPTLEETTLPLSDILQLIESKVADQVGELEISEPPTEDPDRLTAADLENAIAEKMAETGGVDNDAVEEKINLLEDKLKIEARAEFEKVSTVVNDLSTEGRAKFTQVEGAIDSKLDSALKAGLGKIAEAESAMAIKAQAEVDKAKEDGKAYLVYQMAEFKKEILVIIDQKIKKALGGKDWQGKK